MPIRSSYRRLSVALALLAFPLAAALTLLVVLAGLDAWAALAAGLFCLAVTAALLWPHLRHLSALARQAQALAAEQVAAETIVPLPARSIIAAELDDAMAEAVRAWRQRRLELERLVRSNQAIVESLPDPLIMVARGRRVLRANPAAIALFGELETGRDLISMVRNPALIEALDAALQGGSGRVVEFVQPVPVERILSAHIAPLAEEAPDGMAAIIALHDLTPIRRAEQLRADFVANASHELRTPLSTLIGFIETLRGPAADDGEARSRFLAIMHEQANRMARLVADLLSLSRIELNEHSAPTGQVDLGRLLTGVADTLELKAEERGMRIEIVAESGALEALPPAIGDPDELAQVFQNLIDNAIKYGRPGTAIRVALRLGSPPGSRPERAGGRGRGRNGRRLLAVSVIDQGEGIAREHIPRLTERFYRVDAARSRDLGGTGLGLAIVKHIVSRHRGRLEIESEVGKGSVFRVLLPAAN
jgi:two-component system phosphate regulon sensor histidine kinase PhoR